MTDLYRHLKKGLARALYFVLVDLPLGVLHLLGVVLSLFVEAAPFLNVLFLLLLLLFLFWAQCAE